MDFFSNLMELAAILPTPPTGTPNELAADGIEFFETWLKRIGGFVAFIGAIKLALNIKNDDTKEQLTSILTMVAGFMICDAVGNLDIFNIPDKYTEAAAKTEFDSIVEFIGDWVRRVGAFGMALGAIMFGFAIKDNDAGAKVNGTKAFVAGAIVVAIAGILETFI